MQALTFHAPAIPVVNNVDVAEISDPQSIKDALARQAFNPVRWVEVVRAIAARGVTHVGECGPGKVLAGMTGRIEKSLNSFALTDPASIAQALESLK